MSHAFKVSGTIQVLDPYSKISKIPPNLSKHIFSPYNTCGNNLRVTKTLGIRLIPNTLNYTITTNLIAPYQAWFFPSVFHFMVKLLRGGYLNSACCEIHIIIMTE